MKFDQYKNIEDFVTDLQFIDWVKNPTPDNQRYWQQYMQANPEKVEMIHEAKILVQSVLSYSGGEVSYSSDDYDEVKSNIRLKIDHPGTGRLRVWLPRAAVIFILISLTLVIRSYWLRDNFIYYQTAFGETREIVLPDQSRVILNANSSLKTYKSWQNISSRELWLSGEAFFEVKQMKNGEFPPQFLIHTQNDLEIEVLGTSFNVNDRHEQAQVVLNSGTVKISAQQIRQDLVIKPGESITYSAITKQLKRQKVQPEQYLSWTNNQLQFENAYLVQIEQKVRDLFGLELEFVGFEKEDKKFTGSTPYQELEILFVSLAKTFDLKYKRSGQKIIFSKNPAVDQQ
ncbi:MAG: FecR family protein [Candidatus Cyclobacteriaceae bacterium M3_2C_046]